MSREKQIEEMVKDLCDIECKGMKCDTCDGYACEYRMQAEALYNAGYSKQSEGEWEMQEFPVTQCSQCGMRRNVETQNAWNFCPNCGANMKGGAE